MLDYLRNYATMYVEVRKCIMYAVKYPDAYFDNNEQKLYFTTCRACGWVAAEGVDSPGDCLIDECPDCGSDYIQDVPEFV